jgi:hypothetical protein
MIKRILLELREHAPFTALGTVAGALLTVAFVYANLPHKASEILFATFHPAHVFFSAIVTTAMFRLHHRPNVLAAALVGLVGSLAVGTLSDSVMPFLGERLMEVHDPHVHGEVYIGFIKIGYLVLPAAVLGVLVGYLRPRTKMSHAIHILLSTAASLAHILMSLHEGGDIKPLTFVLIPVFLFLAVWVPCCSSDIVLPLLFCRNHRDGKACAMDPHDTHRHHGHGHPHGHQ